MLRTLLILSILLSAASLAAQSDYGIQVRTGVGDVVTAPYTRVSVQIARGDSRPFVGRVVVETSSNMFFSRRRRPQQDDGEIVIMQDVTLGEGTMTGVVNLDVPVGVMLNIDVRLVMPWTS